MSFKAVAGEVGELSWSLCANCRTRPSQTGANCAWCSTCAVELVTAAGMTPLDDFTSLRAPWRCRCDTCGEVSSPTAQNLRAGHRCRYCAARERARVKFERSRARAHAELAAIGLAPLGDYPGTTTPWPATCLTCGASVSPLVGNIRAGRTRSCGNGCRPRQRPNKWDHAAIIELAAVHGYTLAAPVDDEFDGVSAKWNGTCDSCGRTLVLQPNRMADGGSGCRPCAAAAASVRLRTPEATAVAAMRAVNLEPLEPYVNAQTPWACLCQRCQTECSPTYWSVAQGRGTGLCRCPGGKGLRDDDSAYVYLMESTVHAARKVGIGKAGSIRLSTNAWQGFARVLEVAYCDGATARRVERDVLAGIADADRAVVARADMPFGGYRETFRIEGNETVTLTAFFDEVLVGQSAMEVDEMRLAGRPDAAAWFVVG